MTAIFEVFGIDVMDTHGAALKATGAWNWRITFSHCHGHILEAIVRRADVFHKL